VDLYHFHAGSGANESGALSGHLARLLQALTVDTPANGMALLVVLPTCRMALNFSCQAPNLAYISCI